MVGYPVSGLLAFIGLGCLLLEYVRSKVKTNSFFVLFLILLPSIAITSRTTFYLFLIFLLPIYIYLIIKSKNSFVIFLLLAFFTLMLFDGFFETHHFQKTFEKMFANIINYFEYGTFHDYSTAVLMNMYVFPGDLKTFVIGNALHHRENYINSDVFFSRITWSTGIFYMTSFIFAFAVLSYRMFKKCNNNMTRAIITVILIGCFLANFKGNYMFSRVVGDTLILLYIYFSQNNSSPLNNS